MNRTTFFFCPNENRKEKLPFCEAGPTAVSGEDNLTNAFPLDGHEGRRRCGLTLIYFIQGGGVEGRGRRELGPTLCVSAAAFPIDSQDRARRTSPPFFPDVPPPPPAPPGCPVSPHRTGDVRGESRVQQTAER